MAKADAALEHRIAAVRRFNRFYTQRIGVLREHLLDSPFPLTGVRVLYELAHWPATGEPATAAVLAARLALDEGYLSRILRGFEQRRLVRKKPSSADGRRKSLALSEHGRRAFAALDARSRAEVGAMLGKLAPTAQVRFARRAAYRKLRSWTQGDLDAARPLYTQAGFRRVHEERHESFGKHLVAETWELPLQAR